MKAISIVIVVNFLSSFVASACNFDESQNSNVASGGCKSCSDTLGSSDGQKVACLTCKANFGLDNSSPRDCAACSQYKYSDEGATECLPCATYCATCSSMAMTGCTSCKDGYFKTTEGSLAGECRDQCPTGYKDVASKTCKPCTDPTCLACDETGKCKTCNKGYFIEVGTCYPCLKDCLACFSETTCNECGSGLLLA